MKTGLFSFKSRHFSTAHIRFHEIWFLHESKIHLISSANRFTSLAFPLFAIRYSPDLRYDNVHNVQSPIHPGSIQPMKKQFSKIHPDLQPMAKMTPAFHFSRRNLSLVQLLINMIPATRPRQISWWKTPIIEGCGGSTKNSFTHLQASTQFCPNASPDLAARRWIYHGQTGDGRSQEHGNSA